MNLSSDFEDELRDGALNQIEQTARDEIAPDLRERIQSLLEDYGDRHDYDVRALVDAVETEVKRAGDTVRVVARLPDPALLFERGTVDHVVEAQGDGVLSFVWSRKHNPPQWVRDEFEREADGWRVFLPSVEVSGLPEGRFIRDALHEIRRSLEA
jgi:hypothetical protein